VLVGLVLLQVTEAMAVTLFLHQPLLREVVAVVVALVQVLLAALLAVLGIATEQLLSHHQQAKVMLALLAAVHLHLAVAVAVVLVVRVLQVLLAAQFPIHQAAQVQLQASQAHQSLVQVVVAVDTKTKVELSHRAVQVVAVMAQQAH
jgi:hypothetical protein